MKLSAEQNIFAGIVLVAGLTKQQAEQIYEQGKESVVFALFKQVQMLADKNNLSAVIAAASSTPSFQKTDSRFDTSA